MKVTITNASGTIAGAELKIDHGDREQLTKTSKKLERKDGKPIWRVSVPVNGERILTYRVVNLND